MKNFFKIFTVITILFGLLVGCSNKGANIDTSLQNDFQEFGYEIKKGVLNEDEYLIIIRNISDKYSSIIGNINNHIIEAIDYPFLTEDKEWRVGYNNATYPIYTILKLFETMEDNGNVPKDFRALHLKFKMTFEYLNMAVDIPPKAIKDNQVDLEKLYEAVELMQKSVDTFSEIRKDIESYRDNLINK